MRKTTCMLSLLLLLAANETFAQKMLIGIKGGIQSSAFRIKSKQGDHHVRLEGPGIGFVAGAAATCRFSDQWSIQPNLLFTMKKGGVLFNDGKMQQYTIDLPVNVLYRHQGFFLGAGPNFSYGLSAKGIPYDSDDPKEDFYSANNNGLRLKRFELGINSLMGYEFPGGINITANFTSGLSDILDIDNEPAKVNTRMFGVSVGYTFIKQAR